MVTAIHLFSHIYEQLKVNNFLYFLHSGRPLHEKNRKCAKTLTRFFIGISIPYSHDSIIGVSLLEQNYQTRRKTMKISCQSCLHHSISFAERQEMARLILFLTTLVCSIYDGGIDTFSHITVPASRKIYAGGYQHKKPPSGTI